jgi:hypothetical protein
LNNMKKLLVIFFLLISFLGSGQSVSAPDSKSFIPSTTGQDASGFVLNGFATTDVILASISLVNPPASTTFYLGTTTGLTAASGFTLTGNKTRLVVTGSMANINTALTSLKINTGSVKGNVVLSVAATINPTGYYYNGVNGHFYKPVSTGAYYTIARANALATTFKGQQGYLVTITSADEDAFIYANVPQGNIWFALTDEAVEGQWRIDAGPEKGTLIKTSNGQLNGNIQGQYNNWAGGEPNNSGNEDYAVTKWGGGSQWNDLPNAYSCAYVIEFGTWSNPDDATFTEFYTNSTTHSNGEVLTARFNFDFGGNVDETKFSAKANTYVNNVWGVTTNTSRALSGLGKVDITNDLDTIKVGTGYKPIITGGGVEWAYVNPNATWLNGNSRLLIDMRKFGNVNPSTVTKVKILDVYDGAVTFISNDGTWAQYNVPSALTKVTDGTSSFNQYIRNVNGWNTDYAFACDVTFEQTTAFKQHGIDVIANSQTDLNTLYNSIVTVSDVYLAFKELSNGGLFGNEIGKEFGYGVQYMNADVDGNGVFNETDTYKLLQHLTGAQSLTQYSGLTYLMKLYSKSDYDSITKSNWNTQFNSTRSLFPFSLNTGTLNNTYNVNVTWVGDVNLSHSAQPLGLPSINSANNQISQIKSMAVTTNSIGDVEADIMMEKVGDSVVATINLNSNGNQIGATQFDVYFDNSILEYSSIQFSNTTSTNFGKNTGSVISLGSLNTSGGSISNIEYKVVFKPKTTITNLLGLISVKSVETINTSSNKLNVKVI